MEVISMQILSDLWFGNIAPHERPIPPSREYRQMLKTLSGLGEQIRETVSPEQKKLLDKYEKIYTTVISINEEDAFIVGFRLGAQIILEVLGNHHSI